MESLFDRIHAREFACEVLFEQDIDGRSIATLILDALLEVRSRLSLQEGLVPFVDFSRLSIFVDNWQRTFSSSEARL